MRTLQERRRASRSFKSIAADHAHREAAREREVASANDMSARQEGAMTPIDTDLG